MKTSIKRALVSAAAVVLLAPVLASCGAGGQSKSDACATLQEGLSSIQTEIQTAVTEAATSGAGADALNQVKTQISDLSATITNDEVKTAFTDFETKFSALADEVSALGEIDQTDATALQDVATKVQTASTELTAAGTNVDAVCSG